MMLDLDLLPEEYAVCRLAAGSPIPAELLNSAADPGVVSITRTADEVSIICRIDRVPDEAIVETPWRCLRVVGQVNLATAGVLASLIAPLAQALVNIVAFSTYDTDYVLVPTVRLTEAVATLTQAGHRVTV